MFTAAGWAVNAANWPATGSALNPSWPTTIVVTPCAATGAASRRSASPSS